MELQIFTPEKTIIAQAQTEELYATGPKGEFGVLPGYAHYVTPLSLGPLRFEANGKKHAYLVEGGYMEVFEEKIFVAADHVESAASIDVEANRAKLSELDKKLSQETLSPEEFTTLITERNRTQTRLDVAGH